jgi:hypothetical protein
VPDRLFECVRTVEFFDEGWNKPQTHGEMCRNLRAFVELSDTRARVCVCDRTCSYFNTVAAFVTTIVVSERGLRRRAKLMAHVVKIAAELRALNNFHLLMACVSAFSNSALGRLKWTRTELPKKIAEQLAALDALMNVQGSFKVRVRVGWADDDLCVVVV